MKPFRVANWPSLAALCVILLVGLLSNFQWVKESYRSGAIPAAIALVLVAVGLVVWVLTIRGARREFKRSKTLEGRSRALTGVVAAVAITSIFSMIVFREPRFLLVFAAAMAVWFLLSSVGYFGGGVPGSRDGPKAQRFAGSLAGIIGGLLSVGAIVAYFISRRFDITIALIQPIVVCGVIAQLARSKGQGRAAPATTPGQDGPTALL